MKTLSGKNLLLIAALGTLISGCEPTATNTAATDVVPTTAPTNTSESTASTMDSSSNSPTDAQREMAAAEANAPQTSTSPATASADGSVKPKDGDEVAVMETSQGRIVLMFFPDKAPLHVDSFKKLAKKNFFDNTAFHRVIPGFMIQGGDPNSDPKRQAGPPGTGGPGYTVKAEPNDVKHVRGILSAARSQDRDSAGSQFFIMHAEYPSLDGEYDPYGRVVSGLDVVDKIVALATDGNNMPTAIDQARVKSVRIVKWPVK